jgi:membrane protease YdiL (CAAX protease family)
MFLFWVLSFAIAWALTLPPALAQLGIIERSPVPYGTTMLIGLAPITAAAVAAARARRGVGYWWSLARLPRPGWTAVLAILLPPLVLGIAYTVHGALGRPIRIALDLQVAVMGLVWLVLAFGEEAGWRGFALPRLVERHGFWLASLILGVVWCVWHYPRLLGSPYLGSLSETLPLIGLFSVQIIISNFIICWLYVRSDRSVLAATLFHASFNLVATAYFLAATDLIVTGLFLLLVLAVALFDRDVRRLGQASNQAAH